MNLYEPEALPLYYISLIEIVLMYDLLPYSIGVLLGIICEPTVDMRSRFKSVESVTLTICAENRVIITTLNIRFKLFNNRLITMSAL